MVGRKKGQSGARVHYYGKSGRYTLMGNIEKYRNQWDYLDSLSGAQGAGSEAIMKGLQLLMEFDAGMNSFDKLLKTAAATYDAVGQILEIVQSGVALNDSGRYELNEEGKDQLQSLVSKFIE